MGALDTISEFFPFLNRCVDPRVKDLFWAYLEWLSRKRTKFDNHLRIFWGKNHKLPFFPKLWWIKLTIVVQSQSLIIWKFFWGAACHSSSKIDKLKIFDHDFQWFFSLCPQSPWQPSEAKLMASVTSPGCQTKC